MNPVSRRAYRIEWRDDSGPWIALPSRFTTREEAERYARGMVTDLEDVEAARVIDPKGDVVQQFERGGHWS
jgi:hypothetical protein